MEKLKAIFKLYKCRSFHLVTIEQHVYHTQTVVTSNMTQSEYDSTMQNIAEAIAGEIIKRNVLSKPTNQ